MSLFSLILIGTGVGAIFVVFFIFSIRRNQIKRADSSTTVSPTRDDSGDDPTAPTVGMSHSHHDRQRDLTIAKTIIERLDQLDAMIESATKQNNNEMAGQLELFRDEIAALLRECEVEKFEFAPGTTVDVETRSRIEIVGGESTDGPAQITETVRCGFRYSHGDENTIILRKAEVMVG